MWNNVFYVILAFALGVIAFFTQEIVTFVLLSFVLMALININNTLKKILKEVSSNNDN